MSNRSVSVGPAHRIGGIVLREIDYAPGLEQPRHFHEWSSVTLVLQGGLEERVGRTLERAAPLSVVVKPAGVEHSDRVGLHGARTIQIALRPDLLTPEDERGSGRNDWRWLHAGPPARRFLAILELLRRWPTDRAATEAAVFDCLASLGSHERTTSRPVPPRWLARIVEELDETFASKPRVSALASEAGVHPVSLARCFRRHYGTTVTARIRQRRVQRVAELLAGSDRPLSDVAYAAGFSDQSHMCRVFKTDTGLTPGAYRQLTTR